MLDAKLTYRQHTAYIVDKASRNLGLVFRMTKDFTDVYCLKSLYCSLVRSTLEYCSVVWNPNYINGNQRSENVQRRFIRYALRRLPCRDPLRLPSYESSTHCKFNGIPPMVMADLLTRQIDCAALLGFVNLQARSRMLRGGSLLRIPYGRRNYTTNAAMTGLQRAFNRVNSVFDFHVSRDVLRTRIRMFLSANF